MLISYLIPCHKRTEDLLSVMPSIIAAANQSPPVEIVIVDYGDQLPLEPILEDSRKALQDGNNLIVKKYRKRSYYHMAHARNLSLRVATGKYVVISATDIILRQDFFSVVRKTLKETGSDFLRSMTLGYIGMIVCDRKKMMDIGGFDERFEFYGGEDKDMLSRLVRKGLSAGYYDLDALITLIRTSNRMKVANYRLPLTKTEMVLKGRQIREGNDAAQLIVANEGTHWGED